MADQNDSLSVLQSVAGNNQSQAAPAPSAQAQQGQDSLSVLKSVSGNTPINMVGPNGEKQQVAPANVAAMRQKNFALTPENPGVVKAVDYNSGRVNYIMPQEVEDFHNAGSAIVQSDGSIRYPIIRDKNGVIAQDPLEEQKAHQKIYAALNADEKARNQKSELTDAAKAGVDATLYTAAGVSGASALGAVPEVAARVFAPSVVPVAGGVGFGGAAAGEVAGPSLASQAATWVGRQLLAHSGKIIGGGVPTTALITKLMHWW